MSLLRTAAARMMPSVARKPMSTSTVAGTKYGKTFKETWLSDQGAWPVIGILSGAVLFCGAFITHKVFFHPDVRVTSYRRHTVIREWK